MLNLHFQRHAALLQLALLLLLWPALSLWSFLLLLGFISFAALQSFDKVPKLSLKTANIVAALTATLFVLSIRQFGAMHFLMHILLLSALLRLLALRHHGEAQQLVWVHYFIIGCSFLFHQSMTLAFVILSTVAANLHLHYLLFSPEPVPWKRLSRTTPYLLWIIPVWLGLFLLFPRLSPLWQLPSSQQAISGLANDIEPGSIEQLVQSDATAFRVSFDNGVPPPQSQRYWRAKVFEQFDGRRWSVERDFSKRSLRQSDPATSAVESISYQIIAEASYQQSLFSLATPTQVDSSIESLPAGLVQAKRPVTQRISYRLSSQLRGVMSTDQRESELNQVIGEHNPQSYRFAQQLSQRYPEPHHFAEAVLDHFRQQAFYYTLNPPRLGAQSVDDFLFNTRSGFCGHYASATALLLRQAGIPARVVGGYQGGLWYPEQNYLLVRQRDAHAWVEYLVEEQWHQLDPTAAIAPERVLSGLDESLSDADRLSLSSPWLASVPLLNQVRLQLLHLDYYWSVWVLGFNQQRQTALWQSLYNAWRDYGRTGLYVVAGLLALLCMAGLWYLYRLKTKTGSYQLMLRFIPALRYKPEGMPVSQALARLAQSNPALASELNSTNQLYQQWVFASDQQARTELFHRLKTKHKTWKRLQLPDGFQP
ncbi:DUF3488 and transglutaminase-like domain-containing protein [Alkalimonas collagenimarina]|uniref:DUF3488 and transglutaminase-like domain-containing protein n=1 Tax=Alkalimonas collagenimarina TaxID=400390 RepID=A0ABT9H290_9GAMM|nr:DUF3488 and transglutaminase-like domain-containing protein [Alkalimonas collagenimarina]MDP4537425.1 DUF3488 and transglutaminase-like domain-containing protein [Alkalimonas collagenimarina]